jgi:signal transduction histidine kinase/ActR/RegA family two-component response regulator
MLVEPACLDCHARQGYALGDIRGGISVAVPIQEQWQQFRKQASSAAGIHGLIWLAGLSGIVFGGRRVGRSMRATREAGRRADEASRAKSEFLAAMSHEVRTPLNGVAGLLQLLQDTPLNAEQRGYAERAVQSCRRLERLVGDIMDISRVEAGALEVRAEPFALAGVLETVEQAYARAFRDRGLALQVDVDPAVPDRLQGDGSRLQQVLLNLVGNALKFTEAGEVAVDVSLLPPGPSGRHRVLFQVSDTGMGMDDTVYPRVFESFAQGEGGRARSFQGAGLGLAIVRRLVELMGGTIAVESEPGAGTTFWLSIPFDPAPAEANAAEAPAGAEPPAGLRVLLVEDDPVNQVVAKRLLEKCGQRVRVASNGHEALEALRAGSYDMVFMDIEMPVLDGVATLRAIREGRAGEASRDLPVVAMTAYTMPGDKESFLGAGMDGYVSKPIQMAELRDVLVRTAPR